MSPFSFFKVHTTLPRLRLTLFRSVRMIIEWSSPVAPSRPISSRPIEVITLDVRPSAQAEILERAQGLGRTPAVLQRNIVQGDVAFVALAAHAFENDLELSPTRHRDGGVSPQVALVTASFPQRTSKTAALFDVNSQVGYVQSVHVIPELKAFLAARGDVDAHNTSGIIRPAR